MRLVDAVRIVPIALASLVALTHVDDARACGPDFPNVLLRDRTATMLTLVDGSFDWETAHLIIPALGPSSGAQLVAVEYLDSERERAVRSQGGSIERALYDEGANHFHAGDPLLAEKAWRKLLALPRDERIHRSTWAAYMLGRSTGNAKWFQRTRALAHDGFHDALGLAVASYGEEARMHLDTNVARAVHLYAEQAAHGSGSGSTSLLLVARRLVNDASIEEGELARAARDPLVRKLVAAYLFTRSNEIEGAWDGTHVAKVERLVRVIERASTAGGTQKHDDGVDRLAAAAYRAGQWTLAKRLVHVAGDGPLASWVRAKLALRDGKPDLARTLLARASTSFPAGEDWGSRPMAEYGDWETVGPRERVNAERAVLAVEDRQYASALSLFLASGDDRYWADAAYVAERVMSLDELVAYVEEHAPTHIPVVESCWGAPTPSPLNALRAILARRLLRAGRNDDATRFFDDATVREHARTYAQLVAQGRSVAGDRFDRARSLWTAASVARVHGMEILGFELDPDWAMHDGNFDLGVDWSVSDEERARGRQDTMVPRPAFSTYDEQLRVMSTASKPLARFHYRVVAGELAAEAAALLPPRSQAYAAALCEAAAHVGVTEGARASTYYQRYVDNGAYVDFAAHFGSDCPAPDFASARTRYDDADRLRPEYVSKAPPPPVRKRVIARDTAVLLAIAFATRVLARTLAKRGGVGAGLP